MKEIAGHGANLLKAFFTNPISYVLGAITLGSVIFTWGVSTEKKGNAGVQLKNEIVKEVEQLFIPIKIQQDTLFKMLQRHTTDQDVTLKIVNDKLDDVSSGQAALKKLVTTEFAKAMTPRQVNEMWESFEKKKSMTSLLPTVLTQKKY